MKHFVQRGVVSSMAKAAESAVPLPYLYYLYDLDDLDDLARVAGWEPYTLQGPIECVSWVKFGFYVLCRSCSAYHSSRPGSI